MTANKADVRLFDARQSKWTINAKYKHSSMLMFLWGSLMAPVVSVKCVLKNCIGKPSKTARIGAHSLTVPFQAKRGGRQKKKVVDLEK